MVSRPEQRWTKNFSLESTHSEPKEDANAESGMWNALHKLRCSSGFAIWKKEQSCFAVEDGWNLVHCPEQGGAEHFVTEENEFTPRKSSLYPAESSSKPSEMPDDYIPFHCNSD